MASNEQKARMKQNLVDTANEDIYSDSQDLSGSLDKVFGGGRVQDVMGGKPVREDAVAMAKAAARNADLSNPSSVASVRKAMPDNAAIVMAKEKALEMQQNQNIPEWAREAPDLSGAADDINKKQMQLEALKKMRGY